ncbi:adenylate kinase [Spiroplasma alleghenense]|uniref:Adenylate kinase n=1 Tax=Spiroplasma alleghenense TaxID=216931 RepID=A0A345Z349_9MOLU|nr:adenylate kinase [Spiroplasma alleghenense]AXK51028.1 adenylate kinase [Spiroplasma alleghenense]
MNIILLGAPGSGKGTQAEKLVQNFNFEQLSTGDLFRKNISEKTQMGLEASKLISAGKLVPDEITNKMVEEYLKNGNKENIIFDGYPRTINQAKALKEILVLNNSKIDKVILLDVEEKILLERLVGRLICPKCKRSYHLKNRPPKKEGICDFDNSSLETRPDDKPEKIAIRLQSYLSDTSPLIDYYKTEKKLVKISVSNLTSEKVFEKIREALKL